jgi:hypothetical protein
MLEPDIIVTERGDYAERFIVIEVKAHAAALLDVEDELRTYMVQNNFTLGMLIAPGAIRLYRNLYTSYGADSVSLLGAYPLADFDGFARAPTWDPSAMANLEDAVPAMGRASARPRGADSPRARAPSNPRGRVRPPMFASARSRAAKHRRWPSLASGRGLAMRHVFVETNWVVDWAAPIHHQDAAAAKLLADAEAGRHRLYLPAVCLTRGAAAAP